MVIYMDGENAFIYKWVSTIQIHFQSWFRSPQSVLCSDDAYKIATTSIIKLTWHFCTCAKVNCPFFKKPDCTLHVQFSTTRSGQSTLCHADLVQLVLYIYASVQSKLSKLFIHEVLDIHETHLDL